MRPTRLVFLLLSALVVRAEAAEDPVLPVNLWNGEGVSLGNWLLPEVVFQSAVGSSTTDPERLAVGHHDPDRHGATIQSAEFSLSARLARNAFLFANYSAKIDHDDHWADEWEEIYLSVGDLPAGIELKGGRFYTRFGYQNQLHAHAFDFVDQYLANGRIIGEDSMTVDGAEIAFPVVSRGHSWNDLLTVSFGAVPDPDEEGESEFEVEAPFEGEAAGFQDYALTADYTVTIPRNVNSSVSIGVSGAWGKNHFERHTAIGGAHREYLWRPTPARQCKSCSEEQPAEYIRWRTEGFVRQFGAMSDEAEREDFVDYGFYSTLSYGLPGGNLSAHLRGEYVSEVDEAGLPERWRVSPALAWKLPTPLPVVLKLQYNFDHSPSFGNEHTVWAQFTFVWGDCCARE